MSKTTNTGTTVVVYERRVVAALRASLRDRPLSVNQRAVLRAMGFADANGLLTMAGYRAALVVTGRDPITGVTNSLLNSLGAS